MKSGCRCGDNRFLHDVSITFACTIKVFASLYTREAKTVIVAFTAVAQICKCQTFQRAFSLPVALSKPSDLPVVVTAEGFSFIILLSGDSMCNTRALKTARQTSLRFLLR